MRSLSFDRAQLYIHEQAEDQKRRTGRVRKVIVKGRQQGCSTYVEGRAYHYTTTRNGRRAFILAHEQEATNNIFEMASGSLTTARRGSPHAGAANAKELHFDKLDSSIKSARRGPRQRADRRPSTFSTAPKSPIGRSPKRTLAASCRQSRTSMIRRAGLRALRPGAGLFPYAGREGTPRRRDI